MCKDVGSNTIELPYPMQALPMSSNMDIVTTAAAKDDSEVTGFPIANRHNPDALIAYANALKECHSDTDTAELADRFCKLYGVLAKIDDIVTKAKTCDELHALLENIAVAYDVCGVKDRFAEVVSRTRVILGQLKDLLFLLAQSSSFDGSDVIAALEGLQRAYDAAVEHIGEGQQYAAVEDRCVAFPQLSSCSPLPASSLIRSQIVPELVGLHNTLSSAWELCDDLRLRADIVKAGRQVAIAHVRCHDEALREAIDFTRGVLEQLTFVRDALAVNGHVLRGACARGCNTLLYVLDAASSLGDA